MQGCSLGLLHLQAGQCVTGQLPSCCCSVSKMQSSTIYNPHNFMREKSAFMSVWTAYNRLTIINTIKNIYYPCILISKTTIHFWNKLNSIATFFALDSNALLCQILAGLLAWNAQTLFLLHCNFLIELFSLEKIQIWYLIAWWIVYIYFSFTRKFV